MMEAEQEAQHQQKEEKSNIKNPKKKKKELNLIEGENVELIDEQRVIWSLLTSHEMLLVLASYILSSPYSNLHAIAFLYPQPFGRNLQN